MLAKSSAVLKRKWDRTYDRTIRTHTHLRNADRTVGRSCKFYRGLQGRGVSGQTSARGVFAEASSTLTYAGDVEIMQVHSLDCEIVSRRENVERYVRFDGIGGEAAR
jgi:hypothetical protein